MQNLFSMLSRVTGRSRQNDNEEELARLQSELTAAKQQISDLKTIVIDLNTHVSLLTDKVKEISAVNEIVLSVQQGLLEEITYGQARQQSAKVVPIFSFGGNDDDDLPN
jgi:predicted  nucleic acid-binding Zn-ribbon protein